MRWIRGVTIDPAPGLIVRGAVPWQDPATLVCLPITPHHNGDGM